MPSAARLALQETHRDRDGGSGGAGNRSIADPIATNRWQVAPHHPVVTWMADRIGESRGASGASFVPRERRSSPAPGCRGARAALCLVAATALLPAASHAGPAGDSGTVNISVSVAARYRLVTATAPRVEPQGQAPGFCLATSSLEPAMPVMVVLTSGPRADGHETALATDKPRAAGRATAIARCDTLHEQSASPAIALDRRATDKLLLVRPE